MAGFKTTEVGSFMATFAKGWKAVKVSRLKKVAIKLPRSAV